VAERNNSGGFGGQLTDSIIWGGDFTAKMRMWKIGERPHEIALARRVEDGCSGKFKITSIKQWMDGTFIARGDKSLTTEGNGCQYAVLDTMARTLTFKRLEKSLEWIKECDDVRAWDKDVYCFMPGERAFEAVLLQNGKDTVDVPIKFTIGDFWGDVLRPNANLCNFIDDKLFCSGVEWRGGLEFYKDGKVVVDLK
jgi:hypothetical protein